MAALVVILIILSVIALIGFIPLRMRVYIKYENREMTKTYVIKYGFLKIIDSNKRKRKSKSKNKIKDDDNKSDKPKNKKSPSDVIAFAKNNSEHIKRLVNDVVKYIAKKLVRVEKLRIDARIGTDDAMNTALIYGASSAFLYNTIGVMDKHTKILGIDIKYTPNFNEPEIFVEFESIIKTKLHNVFMLALIALLRVWPIIKKRGDLKNGKSD